MENKILQDVILRKEALVSERQYWESQWQEISDYVMPMRGDFNRTTTKGKKRGIQKFDSTATQAVESLAASFQGFLCSPTERWFTLMPEDPKTIRSSFEVRQWLQYVEEVMYKIFASSKSMFYPQCHEMSIDLICFGHGILSKEKGIGGYPISFRSVQVGTSYIQQNYNRVVDTLYRKLSFNSLQLLEKFGNNIPGDVRGKLIEEYNSRTNREYTVWHAVYPRTKYDVRRVDNKNKKFASIYVCEELDCVLSESGFDEFPYIVPRWYTINSEVYGWSPAMTALADIKMLNEMSRTIIVAGQKAVDPPLRAPDDGIGRIDQRPGALTYFRSGTEDKIEPLLSNYNPNIQVGLELENQRRDSIKMAFFADIIQEQKSVEMTRAEYVGREEARMRLFAPQLGRMHPEWLSPVIESVYDVMKSNNLLPETPKELSGQSLKIEYISPLARAQRMAQLINIQNAMNMLLPFIQTDPEMMDAINKDRLNELIMYYNNAPVDVLNSPDEIAQIRQQRQQQQQQLQQMQMLEQGSKAVANLANAGNQGRQ